MTKSKAQRFAQGALAQMVQQFREEFGLTQLQLAILLNVSRSYVSLMERGRRDVNASVVVELQRYREHVAEKISMAGKNPILHVDAMEAEKWIDLLGKWALRRHDIEFSIRAIKHQREVNARKKPAIEIAHANLKSFVHVLDNDLIGGVLKSSHHKKQTQARNVPLKEINDNLRMECLLAEASILEDYLNKYEHMTVPGNTIKAATEAGKPTNGKH